MKRLNLSNKADEEEYSSSSEEEQQQQETKQSKKRTAAAESSSDEEEESDEEFEIPPGFESVRGSSAISKESIMPEDKELWFFKLPKHMDASALSNMSFKLSKKSSAGSVMTQFEHNGRSYALQMDDTFISSQLVNAFPQASDRKKFVLGKPFAQCFSVVEDRTASSPSAVEEVAATPPKTKKSKSKGAEDNDEVETSTKKKKKQKTKA